MAVGSFFWGRVRQRGHSDRSRVPKWPDGRRTNPRSESEVADPSRVGWSLAGCGCLFYAVHKAGRGRDDWRLQQKAQQHWLLLVSICSLHHCESKVLDILMSSREKKFLHGVWLGIVFAWSTSFLLKGILGCMSGLYNPVEPTEVKTFSTESSRQLHVLRDLCLLLSAFNKLLSESVAHAWRGVRPWGSISTVGFPFLSLSYLCLHVHIIQRCSRREDELMITEKILAKHATFEKLDEQVQGLTIHILKNS